MSRENRLPKGQLDAGSAHGKWTSAAFSACGKPVLWSRDWSTLSARQEAEGGRSAGPARHLGGADHQLQDRKALGITFPFTLLGRVNE